MDTNNSYDLDWPYSNPEYEMEWERYISVGATERVMQTHGSERYLAVSNWHSGSRIASYQGGYRCSVRSVTPWENETYLMSNPNFYSRYMDRKMQVDGIEYTHWEGMEWPPTHQKSRVLDRFFRDVQYAYTNNGWRRIGAWNTTENPWWHGVCIMEFRRNCTDKSKQFDLESEVHFGDGRNRIVQDTDLAYRPRVRYTDLTVQGSDSFWKQLGGECVDEVLRGCYNNGTCVAPNTCECSEGWTGYNCNTPVCQQTCLHGGNCTQPGICTCERGWTGDVCTEPLCAQDCLNDGVCIAPDTCQCLQWENSFRDGRLGGGKPLYQDNQGNPLLTGWTGYDCATPICVQAKTFYLNVNGKDDPDFEALGGHGGDNLLPCEDELTGNLLPRCPQYDIYVTGNEGATYQGGCGFDPYDTGCCIETSLTNIECYRCHPERVSYDDSKFFCKGDYERLVGLNSEKEKFKDFLDIFGNFKLCGAYHNPPTRLWYREILY
eukprot:GSChrysophyteH2.ASY1.ANO1.62.1 assembled CDS